MDEGGLADSGEKVDMDKSLKASKKSQQQPSFTARDLCLSTEGHLIEQLEEDSLTVVVSTLRRKI